MKKRGRPAKPEDKKKLSVSFRATPDAVKAIEKIKAARGTTATDAITEALLYYAVIANSIDDVDENIAENEDEMWAFGDEFM